MRLLLVKYNSHVTYLFLHVLVLSLDSVVLLPKQLLLFSNGVLAEFQLLLELLNLSLKVTVDVDPGLPQVNLSLHVIDLYLINRQVGCTLHKVSVSLLIGERCVDSGPLGR